MNRFERIVRGLLKPINPYASIILGVFTMFWGLWIINPFWTVFTHAALYSKAGEFAPEWAWGTWSTTCGLFIIFSILTHRLRLLVYSMLFATWHWFTISGMFWWGDWQNTGGLTYTFVALYAVYVYLNLNINRKLGEMKL